MTDDYRNDNAEGVGHHSIGADDVGDPVVAFEALRETVEDLSTDLKREMMMIREGVEAAFDEFDKVGTPIDYRTDLGNILEQLKGMSERVHGIEKSPSLRQGPEHHARELSRTGDALIRSAAERFEYETRAFRSAAQDLMNVTAGVRERKRQNWWLAGVGGAGVIVGVLFALFAPRVLPFSAAPRVASIVMANNAWQAGWGLLSFASPVSAERVAEADKLVLANKEAVEKCRAAAVKAGREQKCTITISAP